MTLGNAASALTNHKKGEEMTKLEEFAEAFADAVRQAFSRTYGPPRRKDVAESVYASWSDRGVDIGWQEPDPRVVVVGTEHAWIQDPWSTPEDHELWTKTVDQLTKEGWGNVAFESINAAVHIVWIDFPGPWNKILMERARRRSMQ